MDADVLHLMKYLTKQSMNVENVAKFGWYKMISKKYRCGLDISVLAGLRFLKEIK